MPAKYLRDIHFSIESKTYPPAGKSISDAIITLHRANGLRNFIFQRLHHEKTILEVGVRDVRIQLKDTPDPEPQIYKDSETKLLCIDIDYDPNQLYHVDEKNQVLGPLFVSLTREALTKVTHIGDFPFSLIEEALEAYEEAGYCYKFKAGERTIPGTKTKGAVFGELSCESLLRKLVISYRGKKLVERVIANQELIPVYYNHFPNFRLKGYEMFIGSEITDRNLATVDLSNDAEVVEIIDRFKQI